MIARGGTAMNINHLGDALDHWKGCIIQSVEKHLHNLRVVPMFTDDDVTTTWSPKRLRLYAELLHINTNDILHRRLRFESAERNTYFAELRGDYDLFIDPDTGIAPKSRFDGQHIRPGDIASLLPDDTKRVLMIYQHSSRETDWVDACLSRVVRHEPHRACWAFAYRGGDASMVFIARSRGRLNAMRRTLKRFDRVTDLVCESQPSR
jgi:hypothetical protein